MSTISREALTPKKNMNCPLCHTPLSPAFHHQVLGHLDVAYFQCPTCGFLQTEPPTWLEEAYATSYTAQDSGIVSRCLQNRIKAEVIFSSLFGNKGTFVDIGGGIGLFTRMMRDIGFDFRTSDKYAEPILARGFEAGESLPATALTAFEVLEHTENPLEFLRENLQCHGDCRTILLSTSTFEGTPPPETWPYYGFEHGQHISFFTRKTMGVLAKELGLVYIPVLRDMHLLTDRRVSARLRLIFRNRALFLAVAAQTRLLRRGRSFTQADSKK